MSISIYIHIYIPPQNQNSKQHLMSFLQQNQSFLNLFSSRIRNSIMKVNPFQSFKQIIRESSKIVLSDPSMQLMFRKMIQDELQKEKTERNAKGLNSEDDTKNIRHNIKKLLVKIIRQEYSKLNRNKEEKVSNHKNTKAVIDVDACESKSAQVVPKSSKKEKVNDQIVNEPKKTAINQTTKDSDSDKKSEDKVYNSKEEESKKAISDSKAKQALINKYLSFIPKPPVNASSPLEKTSEFGHFLYGDKVSRIIDYKATGPSQDQQTILIEWQKRSNETIPTSSMLSFSEFSYYRPMEAKLFLQLMNQKK